jgi:hypothetical protein
MESRGLRQKTCCEKFVETIKIGRNNLLKGHIEMGKYHPVGQKESIMDMEKKPN